MTHLPGNSGYDSLSGPVYDPEKIANEAIWPLVDCLWLGNYREEGMPGTPFVFPKVGIKDGEVAEVSLQARTYVEDIGPRREAGIFIEKPKPEAIDSLIELAQNDVDAMMRLGDLAEQGVSPDKLRARLGLAFGFDTKGGFEIRHYLSLQEPEGEEIVHVAVEVEWENETSEEGGEDEGQSKLTLNDKYMDELISALNILQAPYEYVAYLDRLRHPEEYAFR